MEQMEYERVWLTLLEFSRLSSVSVRTLRRRCAEGQLKCRNFGTETRAAWRIHISEIDDETRNQEKPNPSFPKPDQATDG